MITIINVELRLKSGFLAATKLLKFTDFTEIYCDDHSSLTSTTAVQYEFHIYSYHFTAREDINSTKLTSLPMCGFTSQLVEHRTGVAEVTGSNPVESR